MSTRGIAGMTQRDNVIIRKAVLDDAFALSQIEKECFSEPWSENVFAEDIKRETSATFVAECDEKIIGFVNLSTVLDEANINNVAVTEDFRRMGVAQKLLDEAFSALDEISFFHLEVREGNFAAISLYEKNGFLKDGLRKNFYKNPTENAILMTKRKE